MNYERVVSVKITGITRPGKIPAKMRANPGSAVLEVDALTTSPARCSERCVVMKCERVVSAKVTGMTGPGKIPAQVGIEPGSAALKADALTTRPTRQSER